MRFWLLLLCGLLLPAQLRAEPGVEFFENKIRPLFVAHCYSCHSAKEKKSRGGLTLDTRGAILKGGDTGPAVDPGKVDKSLLIQMVRYKGEAKMPPKGKLPEQAIADLERWVAMGAPAPEGKPIDRVGIDWPQARRFWAYQLVKRPAPPAVKNADWTRNAIDRFVLARLESDKLSPVSQADRRTLVRRLSYDLTGLPPTPEEIDAFLNDERADAYERLVDRLLASPAYGERWARHWLDVARYAEDQAHTFGVKPNTNAWRYRDWVVNSLNADLSYDRFVKLQVAADQMSDAQPGDRAALGFFGLGAQYYKNSDAARAAADELDDRVDTLTRGFLGLTVSCARCHDHKYDPIPTQDYYSIAGIFWSSKLSDVSLASKEDTERYQAALKRTQDTERAYRERIRTEKLELSKDKLDRLGDYMLTAWDLRVKKETAKLNDRAKAEKLDALSLRRMVSLLDPASKLAPNVAMLTPWRKSEAKDVTPQAAEQLKKRLVGLLGKDDKTLQRDDKQLATAFFGDAGVFPLSDAAMMKLLPADRKAKMDALKVEADKAKREQPTLAMAHGLSDAAPVDMKVYVRGNPATPGVVAPRRFLKILAGDEPTRFTKGSGRLELAAAIATKDNPLTARVLVNRLWAHHFGRGIVNTPSNFGELGERPTHPELLDWLASELVDSGWSLKHVHRLIVTSTAYRLSSANDAQNLVKDPDNRTYWRMNRRRLDVESWRDGLLAVSGQLQRVQGGMTLDLNADSNQRRTLYARVSRHELNGLLRLFDFPDANITSEKRTETTVPQQQLFVLNSPFIVARAKALAARVQTEATEDGERVKRVYALVFGRPPSEMEAKVMREYLAGEDDGSEKGKNQLTRAERMAQVLLASNEFMYVD